MIRVALVVALCASCVQSEKVTCDDGRVCAPGYYCDDENHRCLSAEQVAACSGLDEGAACTFGGAPGACRMGACEPLVCGDGVRSIGEACDGTDLGDADCTTAGFYDAGGLACTEFCTFDVSACTGFCGDNITNGDELCDGTLPQTACTDLGFDAGALACATSCGYSFATCGRFGWLPESTGLATAYAFAGTSTADLWVTGADTSGNAVIAHYDGATWTRTPTGTTDLLVAVAAISANDAWVAGAASGSQPRRPLRWNGTQWNTDATAPLAQYTAVWAASSTAVFFATRDAGVQRFDGSSWSAVGALSESIVAIDGASATDVWAAKADGSLVHWNGSAWLPVAVDVSVRYLDVLSAASVWVTGPSTTSTAAAVAHWNGSSWTTYTDPSVQPDSFTAIVARADNDVWVTGPLAQARHFDGLRWTDTETRITTDSLAGVGALHAFGDTTMAVASNGFVHRYRGQMMAKMDPGIAGIVNAVWSAGPNETFIVDSRGTATRYNGLTYTRAQVDTTSTIFSTVFGSAPNDVWTSGSHGRVWHYDGMTWSQLTQLGGVAAIWASAPNDAWFFGAGVTHYDGSFTTVSVGASGFIAASGSGPNDIWAIAPAGAGSTSVAHYNGTTWSVTTQPHDMTAIVALAPNDVFATADNGHILHYDGQAWTDTVVPVSTRLDRIAASAHDDVVASSPTEAAHFDGTRWTPIRIPNGNFSSVKSLGVAPGYIDFLYGGTSGQFIHRLVRTRFWSCRASETGCSDGVDDDCDGATDALDTDC